MALGTGSISLGGSTAGESVAKELGLGVNSTISLGDAAVYKLAGLSSASNVEMRLLRGKSNLIGLAITQNTTNYNVIDAATAAGWNGTSPLNTTVTISSGIYVYSTSSSIYALTIGILPAGSSVKIVNNGYIYGAGGIGGYGGSYGGTGGNGGGGGPALYAAAPTELINNGTISAGGGGGGGGGSAGAWWLWTAGCRGCGPRATMPGPCGGGGGGGAGNGAGGAGASVASTVYYGSTTTYGASSSGWSGSINAGGGGGAGGIVQYDDTQRGGNGGSGGGLNAIGGAGGAGDNGGISDVRGYLGAYGGGGGAAGYAISGKSNITYTTPGTIYGTQY